MEILKGPQTVLSYLKSVLWPTNIINLIFQSVKLWYGSYIELDKKKSSEKNVNANIVCSV